MSVSKKEVLLRFRDSGVIPVFYHPDVDILMRIVSICYHSGSRVFDRCLRVYEFMHQRAYRGLRFFMHLNEQLDQFPGIVPGVGTVLDAPMTERYVRTGAQFIASPFLRPDRGRECEENDIWMPVCATVGEMNHADELHTEAINVLPGNVLGFEIHSAHRQTVP